MTKTVSVEAEVGFGGGSSAFSRQMMRRYLANREDPWELLFLLFSFLLSGIALFIRRFLGPACSLYLVGFFLRCAFLQSASAQSCGSEGIAVQVLGSGGPELQDKRASSSYLVWEDGRARVLVDAGGGSAVRFGESGALMSQLDVILFTHFHVDHSADFPTLIFSSWFEDRKRSLPIYGPLGNNFMPSTVDFVHAFFNDRNGIYRYLSELLVPEKKGSYKLQPHNVVQGAESSAVFRSEHLSAYAARVIHGSVPALAWRVEIGGKSIVFSGDTN